MWWWWIVGYLVMGLPIELLVREDLGHEGPMAFIKGVLTWPLSLVEWHIDFWTS